MNLHKLLPFLIAGALGLIIGIERERRYAAGKQPLGVRSFTLLGLLGASAALVEEPLVKLSFSLFAAVLITLGYLRSTKNDDGRGGIGLTTEIAAGVTFALGYISHSDPFVALALGALVLAILLARVTLHRFSRQQLQPNEIQAAATLFVIFLVIVPILPREPVDPWGMINLHLFGFIVAVIAGMQFAGYAAVRVLGGRVGIPITGLLAGLVSSTVAFFVFPKMVKEQATMIRPAAAGAIFATIASLSELLVVTFLISKPLFVAISFPILVPCLVGSFLAFWISSRRHQVEDVPLPQNPLSIFSAIRLAVILAVMLLFIQIVQHTLGDSGMQVASFIAGLGDLHGVSIGVANLYATNAVSETVAVTSLMLAIFGSIVSKLIITWMSTRNLYSYLVTLVLVIMLIASMIAAYFGG